MHHGGAISHCSTDGFEQHNNAAGNLLPRRCLRIHTTSVHAHCFNNWPAHCTRCNKRHVIQLQTSDTWCCCYECSDEQRKSYALSQHRSCHVYNPEGHFLAFRPSPPYSDVHNACACVRMIAPNIFPGRIDYQSCSPYHISFDVQL